MSSVRSETAVRELLEARLEQRQDVAERFFADQADRIARLCHRMAERFARDGRLIAIGLSPADRSDVHHVAVEFVHPVIVGKRALPALGLTAESGRLTRELELAANAQDIVMAFGEAPEVVAAIATARDRGCLTVAFRAVGAEWELEPPTPDAFVAQEIVETTYHVLWELVHVFFDHRGLLEGRTERRSHDAGASSFLYPFLAEKEDDLDAVLEDVRASALMKAEEVSRLRATTVLDGGSGLAEAGSALRACFQSGGGLLALGNGGSATDAADAVADFVSPPDYAGWPARRALDLTADTAIITAIANDIGTEAIFARQIIAYGRAGDVLLTLSTSGNSPSMLSALAEARRRELVTIALVGYDGGRVAAEALADHIVITPSQHIPRIQEAQATAYHLLRELVEV
ncbi:MAG: SIS domain-containing protein [Solirubrobacteraceae bacterium]